jgi:hypothetical protein
VDAENDEIIRSNLERIRTVIKSVSFHGCPRASISGFENLEILCLEGDALSSEFLSSLASLKKLRKVSVVGDLSKFPDVVAGKIEELELGGSMDRRNLEDIARFVSLKRLCIYGTPNLESLEGIRAMIKLEELEILGEVQVADLTPLRALKRLRRVEMLKTKAMRGGLQDAWWRAENGGLFLSKSRNLIQILMSMMMLLWLIRKIVL